MLERSGCNPATNAKHSANNADQIHVEFNPVNASSQCSVIPILGSVLPTIDIRAS
jgi:hypothetical protein